MNSIEKVICIAYFVFGVFWSLLFFGGSDLIFEHWWLSDLGLFGGVIVMVIVIRDLVKRDLGDPNKKLFWGLAVVFLWPVTIVYLILHGFKER